MQSRDCAVVLAFAVAAPLMAQDVFFTDGEWEVTGSSEFDPDTSVFGDEIDDSAAASDSIAAMSSGTSGDAGTSSGPFLAAFSWNMSLDEVTFLGGPSYYEIGVDVSARSRGTDAPDTDGFASVSFTPLTNVMFEVQEDLRGSNGLVPYAICSDLGATLAAFGSGAQIIDEHYLTPGVYEIVLPDDSVGSFEDPNQDGMTIFQRQVVDFKVVLAPTPGTVGLLIASSLAATRRRR